MSQPEREQLPSRRIADALRQSIEARTFRPGDRLPSERELAATYQTARNTAREAIGLLQAEGLVDVQHGRGAFVRRQAPMIRLGADRYSNRVRRETGLSPFRAEAQRQGKTARVEVPEIGRTIPPRDVADRLGVADDEPSVVQRVNLYFADDEPVQLGTTYIPWTIAEGSVLATEAKTGTGSIYSRFEELGHQITRAREEITARMPRPAETVALAIPPGVPVIEVLHTGIDQDGRAFEVTRFVMRADLNGLDYNLPVED
ncbi:MAG: GntR family transcriptional regulator [Actinobacteria bacterium]|nr:GntR family transcriptional regulator [Actinomycetota bacterium]MBI3686663.1 GntR family transcriptional regulator [Actinomycetota bacterium]